MSLFPKKMTKTKLAMAATTLSLTGAVFFPATTWSQSAPAAAAATAPAPPPAAAPMQTRLEALDTTYKANLRRLHTPVLQDYQRQLELLRQQMAARGRLSDAKAVDKEIEQVKTLLATGGVMPYAALQAQATAPAVDPMSAAATAPGGAPPPPPPGPGPGPEPGMKPGPGRMHQVLLLPASTGRIPGTAANATAKAISPGTVEWTVNELPAGEYDVSMVFAVEKLERPAELQVTYAGANITTLLDADRATGSQQTFRIYRLGRMKLDQNASNEVLQLRTNLPPGQLMVKSVIFAEPRKKE